MAPMAMNLGVVVNYMSFRVIISAVVVGSIAMGNSLQVAIATGQSLTKWQVWSAIIGGIVLMLNDVKSRITPPEH